MKLFEIVFNRASIYDMLFFNIKSVIEYESLDSLKNNNEILYNSWKEISKNEYNADIDNVYTDSNTLNDIYKTNAIKYSEFSKIITITYAKIYLENGKIKRTFKKITNKNETLVIDTFMDTLHQLSTDGAQSTPQIYMNLCGINTNNQLSHLAKRFIYNQENLQTKVLPLILKRIFNLKPWENDSIDVAEVWKFNAMQKSSNLELISNYLNLKKTVSLLSEKDLSEYYWNNINTNQEETLDFVTLQSATETNLMIHFMNTLRGF